MHGIPMVASSPVRHESPIGITPQEVLAYQPPWKALSDFALNTDLERLDPNAPSFHHLVSQVQSNFHYHSPFPRSLPCSACFWHFSWDLHSFRIEKASTRWTARLLFLIICIARTELTLISPYTFSQDTIDTNSDDSFIDFTNTYQTVPVQGVNRMTNQSFGYVEAKRTGYMTKAFVQNNAYFSVKRDEIVKVDPTLFVPQYSNVDNHCNNSGYQNCWQFGVGQLSSVVKNTKFFQNGEQFFVGNTVQVEATSTVNLPPTPPYDEADMELINNQMVVNGLEHCAQTQVPQQNVVLGSSGSTSGSYSNSSQTTGNEEFDGINEILSSMICTQTLPNLNDVIYDWLNEIWTFFWKNQMVWWWMQNCRVDLIKYFINYELSNSRFFFVFFFCMKMLMKLGRQI